MEEASTETAAEREAAESESRMARVAHERRVGVVLGAGAARGWAHIGALQALRELGVRPSVVVGCSSGAVVGASYVTGRLDTLEAFARSLTWRGVLSYFDFSWRGGGLIEGRWLVEFFRRHFQDIRIEHAPIRFGAVATELAGGRETWLTEGPIIDAVRASISLPGLMTPIAIDGRWMVDGALVNPLPVSLCRALRADVILAVSMHGDLVTSARPRPLHAPVSTAEHSSWLAWMSARTAWAGSMASSWKGYWGGRPPADAVAPSPEELAMTPPPAPPPGVAMAPPRPGYFQVMGDSFFIVQNFVSRVRLAADPVDLLIVPKVGGIGILDFHRGAEAIEAGRAAVLSRAEEIRRLCGLEST